MKVNLTRKASLMSYPRSARNKVIGIAGLTAIAVRSQTAYEDIFTARVSPVMSIIVLGVMVWVFIAAMRGVDFALFATHLLTGGRALWIIVPPHPVPLSGFQIALAVWFGLLTPLLALAWWQTNWEFELPRAESLLKWRIREASGTYPRSGRRDRQSSQY